MVPRQGLLSRAPQGPYGCLCKSRRACKPRAIQRMDQQVPVQRLHSGDLRRLPYKVMGEHTGRMLPCVMSCTPLSLQRVPATPAGSKGLSVPSAVEEGPEDLTGDEDATQSQASPPQTSAPDAAEDLRTEDNSWLRCSYRQAALE